MRWIDKAVKFEHDPTIIDRKVILAENKIEGLSTQIDIQAGIIEAKVSDEEARSIFRQEANSFTFNADQINFEGHVFGEDATFTGKISGSEIVGSVFESFGLDNFRNDTYVNIGQGQIHGRTTLVYDNYEYEFTINGLGAFFTQSNGYINYLGSDGLILNATRMGEGGWEIPEGGAIYVQGVLHWRRPDDFNLVPALSLDVGGDGTVDTAGTLRLTRAGRGTGAENGILFGVDLPNGHIISVHNSDFTFYGNRGMGYPLKVRSHNRGNNYRDDFWINSSGQIVSPRTTDNSVTWGGRVAIGATSSVFGYVSSSERFKVMIEDVDVNPYNILQLHPKMWYDKGNTERYAELLTRREKGEEVSFDEIENIERIPGLIAEEVDKAGLSLFVTRDREGLPDGIYEDRLWTLLIPITKDHEVKLSEHEQEIFELKNKVESLEIEIEQLKGVA